MVQSLGFKALIHLVPRTRDDATFHESVRRVADVLRSHTASVASCAVNPMFRVADDPLGRRTVFRAALEIAGDGLEPGILAALAKGLDVQFGDEIHADLSSFLIGEDLSFMSSVKTPVRYQYLMRRRIGLSHDDYLKHYLEVHSKFGLKTPGIVGYRQLHVDLEASRRAAAAAGFGVWAVDSVSQLYLDSVESFIAGASTSEVGPAAVEDERTFVDRSRSFHFMSNVEWEGESHVSNSTGVN